jgi:hypothetical protein
MMAQEKAKQQTAVPTDGRWEFFFDIFSLFFCCSSFVRKEKKEKADSRCGKFLYDFCFFAIMIV